MTHIYTHIVGFLQKHEQRMRWAFGIGAAFLLGSVLAIGYEGETRHKNEAMLVPNRFITTQGIALRPAAPSSAGSISSSRISSATSVTIAAPKRVAQALVQVQVSVSSSSSSKKMENVGATQKESNASVAISGAPSTQEFPAFVYAVFPVSKVPNWGAMRTPEEWDRTYRELKPEDFVPVPRYNLATLTIPLHSINDPLLRENIPIATAKLFYSTRYYGAYDIDVGEFTGDHPGVDLKLAHGTPLGAVAGGRIHAVRTNASLGHHVIIEHHLPDGDIVFSVYGHLDSVRVQEGDNVRPGQTVGTVGMTGNTTGPHVHLQIDRKVQEGKHVPYWPSSSPTREQAARYTLNPITFIFQHARGE